MEDFKGKVVLVTGGSRGIGRACAVEFARRGATVAIGYAANEAAAKETLALVEAAGGKGKMVSFDVCDSAACAAAVDGIVAELGRLDVLVNNAGVAVDGLVMRFKDEDWRRQLSTNLDGAFYLVRAASRPMMRQKSGSIVNLASVVGETGNAGQAAYSAAKAALVGFSKSVAKELASRNIRVNVVSPGFIETDMTARIQGETREKLVENIPLGRLGRPEEVAKAVVFLASDEAAYVTGAVLRVNGGMLM